MAQILPNQILNNPTDSERHDLLMKALTEDDRPEDYDNIIKILSPPPDITNYAQPGEFKNIRVGIIGGGLAGLSAAFELRKLGFDITIFEASEKRVGGRAYTYYFDEEKSLYGEFGAMRVPVSHEITWHYINLFKLSTNLFLQSNPNNLVYLRNTRAKNTSKDIMNKIYPKFNLSEAERNTPWPKLYSDIGRSILLSMSPSVREEIIESLPKYSPEYLKYANLSIRRVYELYGLSEGAIALITSIRPVVGSFPYHSYGEIMHNEYTADFVSPFEIVGGTVNLPLSFYRSLTSKFPAEYGHIPQGDLGNINWKAGSNVKGIYRYDADGRIVVRYENRYMSQELDELFDYVISAIPFSALRVIDIKPAFGNEKMQAIKEIDYIDGQKTLFLCRERFWERGNAAERIVGGASYTDKAIQTIVYQSHCRIPAYNALNCINPNEPGVLVASYNLGLDATRIGNMYEADRVELIKRQIEEVHGLPSHHLDSIVYASKTVCWNNEPWARGAFDILYPGQKKVFLYEMIQPEYNGRVFFAGEHTSRKHAWMQGALYSGMLAANTLAYHSKIHSFLLW